MSYSFGATVKVCVCTLPVRDTYHYEVPHASSLSHQRGDATAAGHQHDLDGLSVKKVVQQLGGLAWVTLGGQE